MGVAFQLYNIAIRVNEYDRAVCTVISDCAATAAKLNAEMLSRREIATNDHVGRGTATDRNDWTSGI